MRFIALVLALVLVVSLSGCSSRPQRAPLRAPVAETTTTTTTTPQPKALTASDIPSMPPPGQWADEVTNPWFPLAPGSAYTYTGQKDGKPTVEVLRVTFAKKLILGVPATVVRDTLRTKGGTLVEDTQDWYAQDKAGNVWYLGEATKTYKADGKTVDSTEGSWQAGMHGALAGVFMPAKPTVGYQQYQEFYPGQAEDQFTIESLTATVSVPYGDYRGAMLTKETTALEPGVVSNKYYVKKLGEVYEVDVAGDNEFNKLVAFTH